MHDSVTIRAEDSARAALEAQGWRLVAQSWGAVLDAQHSRRDHLATFVDRVSHLAVVRRLDDGDAEAAVQLDVSTSGDYPGGVANSHTPLRPEDLNPDSPQHGWGAFDPTGELLAMTFTEMDGDVIETVFTVVATASRGLGLGSAVKAASVRARLDAGFTTFRTGGAAENVAIIAVNRALGYVFDEEWVTLARE